MDGVIKSAILGIGLAFVALACGDGGEDPATESPATSVPLGASASPADSTAGNTDNPTDNCVPQTYEVQSGDVLSGIALQFDVTVIQIAEASDLDDPDVLEIGQKLTSPCPGSDAVEPGDETDSDDEDGDPEEETPTPAA